MSKEKNIKQMSLLEDSHANHSQSQEKEKEQMTIDTSGMKLLESSENANRSILLAKMLKVLLTSNKAWYSDRCKLTWKKKVSKSNVLLYQLQASVLGIKEKESGSSDAMYPTPTSVQRPNEGNMRLMRKQVLQGSISREEASAMVGKDIFKAHGKVNMYPTPKASGQENAESLIKRKGWKKASQHNLTAFVQMYPTPTVGCEEGGEQSERVEQTKSGGFILRKKNNPQMTFGAKLSDAMIYLEKKMLPTPTARDHKDLGYNPITCKREIKQQSIPTTILKNNKHGGKLNPNFVEFLMGYPMNWTKIEPTELKVSETQSFHSSQENLELPSSKQKKMYRTPTAMDVAEDSFVFAAKLLKGKINRSSNSRVQITLSTDVAMEYLKTNPHLIDEYDKPFKIRPNLPNKFEFISYLKSNSTIKDLANKTDLPKTKIEHWFRKDKCFSYPSIEDWNKIKPYLKTIQFDDELTYEIDEDWKS